jgi:hypothetical protein
MFHASKRQSDRGKSEDPDRVVKLHTPTTVEWIFTPYGNDTTYVSITNSGFKGDGDKVVSDALGSKGGFTWVLAGLKASLEHNIELNLIADAFPKGIGEH